MNLRIPPKAFLVVCAALALTACDDPEKRSMSDKISRLETEAAARAAAEREQKSAAQSAKLDETLRRQAAEMKEVAQSISAMAKDAAETRQKLAAAQTETKQLADRLAAALAGMQSLKTQLAENADKNAAAQRLGEFITKLEEPPPPPPPLPKNPPGGDAGDDAATKAMVKLIQIGLQALCVVYPEFCPIFELLSGLLGEALTSPDPGAGTIGEGNAAEQKLKDFDESLSKLSDAQQDALRGVLEGVPPSILGKLGNSPRAKLIYESLAKKRMVPSTVPPTQDRQRPVPPTPNQ